MGIRAKLFEKAQLGLNKVAVLALHPKCLIGSEKQYYLWISGEGKRLYTFIHCSICGLRKSFEVSMFRL